MISVYGRVYAYDFSNGAYVYMDESMIAQYVNSLFNDPFAIDSGFINEIIKTVCRNKHEPDPFNHDPNLVNYQNCTLDVEQMRIMNHSAEFRLNHTICANYVKTQ